MSTTTTSALLAAAAPQFTCLFLIPYVLSLVMAAVLWRDPVQDRMTTHRPYIHKPVFLVLSFAGLIYGIAGVPALVGLGQGDGQASRLSGWAIASDVLRSFGRGSCLLAVAYLLHLYGPRRQKQGYQNLASVLALSVTLASVVLIVSSTVLSFVVDAQRNSTTGSAIFLVFGVCTLVVVTLQLMVCLLLFVIDRHALFVAASGSPTTEASHCRTHSGHSQMFLTSKDHHRHSPLTASSSLSHALHHNHRRNARDMMFSSTLRDFMPYIGFNQLLVVIAAIVRIFQYAFAATVAAHPALDMVLVNVRDVFELIWVAGTVYVFFVLSRPRRKVPDYVPRREHMRHSDAPTVDISATSHSHHRATYSSADQQSLPDLPNTPASTAFPRTPTIPPSVSEEFLASASPDPFSSPAPGTTVFQIQGRRRRLSGASDGTGFTGDDVTFKQSQDAPPVPALPSEFKSDNMLGLADSESIAFPTPAATGSRRIRSGRSHPKLGSKSSLKGITENQSQRTFQDMPASAFRSEPSLVPGAARPRPPRSPMPANDGLDSERRGSEFKDLPNDPSCTTTALTSPSTPNDGPMTPSPPKRRNLADQLARRVFPKGSPHPNAFLASPSPAGDETVYYECHEGNDSAVYYESEEGRHVLSPDRPTPRRPEQARENGEQFLSTIVMNALSQQRHQHQHSPRKPTHLPPGLAADSGSATPTPTDPTPRASAAASRSHSPERLYVGADSIHLQANIELSLHSDTALLPTHVFRVTAASEGVSSGDEFPCSVMSDEIIQSTPSDASSLPAQQPRWGTLSSEQMISPFPPTPEWRQRFREHFRHSPVPASVAAQSRPIPIPTPSENVNGFRPGSGNHPTTGLPLRKRSSSLTFTTTSSGKARVGTLARSTGSVESFGRRSTRS